jgi:hypothetical protein
MFVGPRRRDLGSLADMFVSPRRAISVRRTLDLGDTADMFGARAPDSLARASPAAQRTFFRTRAALGLAAEVNKGPPLASPS